MHMYSCIYVQVHTVRNYIMISMHADDSVQLQVDGGNPLAIDGYIYLCSVNASDGRRAFTGGITQLTIWDNALTDSQMATLSDLVQILHMHRTRGTAPTTTALLQHELQLSAVVTAILAVMIMRRVSTFFAYAQHHAHITIYRIILLLS